MFGIIVTWVESADVSVLVLGVLGIPFFALVLIVVMRTGRPSFLVPRVFRGKEESELRQWLGRSDVADASEA